MDPTESAFQSIFRPVRRRRAAARGCPPWRHNFFHKRWEFLEFARFGPRQDRFCDRPSRINAGNSLRFADLDGSHGIRLQIHFRRQPGKWIDPEAENSILSIKVNPIAL